MATSGTQKVLGGTRAQRYPDPKISNRPNQFGLYQWSVYKARLSVLGQGTIAAESGITSGDTLNLLLFASDIPAITQVNYNQSAGIDVGEVLAQYFPNSTKAVFTYTESAGTTDVDVFYGQPAQGYVGTAKTIRCTGFPSTATTAFGGTGDAESVDVLLWANSATICSPVSPNNPAGVAYSDDPLVPTAPQPIILHNADYTQAIVDANNLIVDSAGKYYVVVGLYTFSVPA